MNKVSIGILSVAILAVVAAVVVGIVRLNMGTSSAGGEPGSTQSLTVDERINALQTSEAWQSADDREALAKELLEQLNAEGKIQGYEWNEDSGTFNFTYEDGTLGGIMVKEFDPDFNG